MRPQSQGPKPYQAHYLSVCCVLRAHVQFCRFDKADSPQTFNDTAITDRYSDTPFFLIDVKMPRSAKDESKIEFYVPETF